MKNKYRHCDSNTECIHPSIIIFANEWNHFDIFSVTSKKSQAQEGDSDFLKEFQKGSLPPLAQEIVASPVVMGTKGAMDFHCLER